MLAFPPLASHKCLCLCFQLFSSLALTPNLEMPGKLRSVKRDKGWFSIPRDIWFETIYNLCKSLTTTEVFLNISRNKLNKARANICTSLPHHCLDWELISFTDSLCTDQHKPDSLSTCQPLANKLISPLFFIDMSKCVQGNSLPLCSQYCTCKSKHSSNIVI